MGKLGYLDGYIIEAENGEFLAQGLWWYPHKKLEDCHVFPPSILERVNKPITVGGKTVNSWETKAKFAYPARYTPGEGVEITGCKILIPE